METPQSNKKSPPTPKTPSKRRRDNSTDVNSGNTRRRLFPCDCRHNVETSAVDELTQHFGRLLAMQVMVNEKEDDYSDKVD